MFFDIEYSDYEHIFEHTADIWTELRNQRVFLTGGTGFFGKWLLGSMLYANEKHNANIDITVMTRDPKRFLARHPEAGSNRLSFHKGDVRFSVFPTEEFSHIIHFATDPGYSPESEHLQIVDGILGGTRRILDFAVNRAKAKRFLYCSSGAVYGPRTDNITKIPETYNVAPSPSDPGVLFGNAKRMCEQLCTHFHHQYGLETRIARCFSFVGPHVPIDNYAIGNFIRDASFSDKITVAGDGSPVRSYMYMSDLVIWLWQILMNGKANTPYNVGSDVAYSMEELANEIQQSIAPDTPVEVAGKSDKHPHRSYYVPSVDFARKELDLEIRVSLPEAVSKTAHWLKKSKEKPQPVLPEKEAKTFVIDIDGVLACLTKENDYKLASPLKNNIASVNRLYDLGHRIILFTARGSATGIDWREVTQNQMESWGVKHHELHLGKPATTYYVDDRMLPLEALNYIE